VACLAGLELQEIALDPGGEEVVSLGIEMCHVVGSLKIESSESEESDMDAPGFGCVEDRYAEFVADFLHRGDRLRVHGQRNRPGGNETDLGVREFGEKLFTQDFHLGSEIIGSLSVVMDDYSIVVPGADNDIVGFVGQLGDSLVQRESALLAGPVVRDAVAVQAEVVIIHIVLERQFVVPGLLDGPPAVLDVTVAEHDDGFAV